MKQVPELALPAFLANAIAIGHPWVYRDHVPGGFRAASGTWVRVSAGRVSAFGLWDARSPIALRLFARDQVPDAEWVTERVRLAWELRAPVRGTRTSAYRWISGEGDGLPGLVVDLYDRHAVLATYADSVEALLPWVVPALARTLPLAGIVQRREVADGEGRLQVLAGELPPPTLVVEEHGLKLEVNLHTGQKTGLFLDHRENRAWVGALARGKRVANLFAYTGAFSLHAARGGAREVTSVDRARPALDAAVTSFDRNGLDPAAHRVVVADVFEWLEAEQRARARYDLVICDPPSFAKSRDQLEDAKRAYVRLTTAGLRVVESGGYYAAASCTSQVGPELFRELLAEAARKARCRFQMVHEAGHALDHPVMAQHPEGRYLKFVVGRVLPSP